MEIYNEKLCLTGTEVWAVIGSNFNTLLSRGQVKNLLGARKRTIVRVDGSADFRAGLYEVEGFPNNNRNKYRDMLYEAYPELKREKALMEAKTEKEANSYFFSLLKPDTAARVFFMGKKITDGERLRYENSAMVLNAMREMWQRSYSRHSASGTMSKMRIGEYYKTMSRLMPDIAERFELSFKRWNWQRLGELYASYCADGYEALLSGKIGNQNARIVDEELENIIISKYCEQNKPYAKWVSEDVSEWLKGDILAAVKDSGEVLEKEYKRKKISAATVLNYLNNPYNRAMLEQKRLSYHKYGAEIRPHVLRKAPMFSLSKISLDDRDLPRKEKSGKRVKAYYAYDVATGAVVGAAYSMKKDENLFVECIRDMFRNLEKWGVGIPMEVEVENHLTRKFEDYLLKAGEVFPFVRWCAPTNSQEKGAEQWNHSKKYGAEKRGGQVETGRWYSRCNTNNAAQGERYYNEETDRYEVKTKLYTYDELVADDLAANEAHNAIIWTEQAVKKHKRNNKFIGKTRFEALVGNVNESVVAITRENLAKYIGIRVTPGNQQKGLKLYRNRYVNALYGSYELPSVETLKLLEPNNYELDCYYFEDDETKMYMYQSGRYVCTGRRIVEVTNSAAEWSEEDDTAMSEQMKYIRHFDKVMKDDAKERIADLYWERKETAYAEIAAAAKMQIIDAQAPLPPEGGRGADPPDCEYADYAAENYAAMAVNNF